MTTPGERIPRVLSIAGSDSGGGAGVQADLKAFAACGVHGMTAITAITAQSTVGVRGVEHISPPIIRAQVAAVAEDIGIDAVKIGMLGCVETIVAVAAALDELPGAVPVVIDPVMVSESGSVLLDAEAGAALVELMLPRATVVTPNLPEARVLAGIARLGAGDPPAGDPPAGDPGRAAALVGVPPADGEPLARAVRALGPDVVVLTGGHRDSATDLLHDCDGFLEIPGPRHPNGAAHGSGCTHASALAAQLAHGAEPRTAAARAREIAAAAVRDGLREIGAGAGPVDVLGVAARAARAREALAARTL